MKMNKRNICDYDQRRKRETEEKLIKGIQKMRSSKEYRNKPLSCYGLAKITGVAVNTIKRFPNIMEMIEKSRQPEVKLKSAHVKVGVIRKLEDAQAVVEALEKMYNDIVNKYNVVMETNLRLNLEIVKLQDEKQELKHQLEMLLKQGMI